MGKKKSAALIALITIVLVGLLFICITPTFPVKSPNSFRSLLSIVDLGRDLDGGYYTVYYPEGVISKSEYETLKAEYDYVAENTPEGETPSVEDPAENYVAYKSIYLSEEIAAESGGVTEEFAQSFARALRGVQLRFEQRGLSDYSLRVQDDYTIRVEIPKLDHDDADAEALAQNMFELFSYSGELRFTDAHAANEAGTAEMDGSDGNIRSATTEDAGDQGYAVVINFTSAGRAAFRDLTSALTSSDSATSATVYLYAGNNQLLGATVTGTLDQSSVYLTGGYTQAAAETMATLINSCASADDVFELSFEEPEYYSMDALMGNSAALVAAAAIGVLVVAMIVFSLVKFKGFGLAHAYGFVTYAIAVIACISLIPAVQVTMGGIVAILFASAIMVSCNYYAFNNIKKEFASGKTLTASVKAGYKKSLGFTIDVHAILVLASLALWLIVTGPAKFASLVFLLCIAASAVCTLLVTRFYFYMFSAQPKNKIAFAGFKREETEDE